jgi:hypothetical protein
VYKYSALVCISITRRAAHGGGGGGRRRRGSPPQGTGGPHRARPGFRRPAGRQAGAASSSSSDTRRHCGPANQLQNGTHGWNSICLIRWTASDSSSSPEMPLGGGGAPNKRAAASRRIRTGASDRRVAGALTRFPTSWAGTSSPPPTTRKRVFNFAKSPGPASHLEWQPAATVCLHDC